MAIYGYARISTPRQNIERQVRNIRKKFPDVQIFQEVYTGTKVDGRREWAKLLKIVVASDTIVFDSVSRMSRNAAEGFEQYMELLNRGINLVFLKEPLIDTDVIKKALSAKLDMTGTPVDYILEGVNRYTLAITEAQIQRAFEESENEVLNLRQRTKEGMLTAKLNGKTIGRPGGRTYETQKAKDMKADILKMSKRFGGTMNNKDCIRILGITANTFYKYQRELMEEMQA